MSDWMSLSDVLARKGVSLPAVEPFVVFLSRSEVERLLPPAGAHLISISDSAMDRAAINVDEWASCSFHYFVDAVYDEEVVAMAGAKFEEIYKSYLLPKGARELCECIRSVVDAGASLIVVNCQAGQSRSAAVARYISEAHGFVLVGDDRRANMTVVRLLKEDAGLLAAMAAVRPAKPETTGWIGWLKDFLMSGWDVY